MKGKLMMTTLLVASFLGSSAIAAPPAGKGKPAVSGPGCKPQVMVVLRGTLANSPGATPTLPFSLQVNVSHANHLGQAYVKAGQPVTVTADSSSKIGRQSAKTLATLVSGDQVLVQARICKADLANGAAPPLTVKHLIAQPASS